MSTKQAQDRKQYLLEYQQGRKRFFVSMFPEQYDEVTAYCSQNGESISGYIKRLINQDMGKEVFPKTRKKSDDK